MEYIVGVDIGNSSTEVALGARDAQGNFRFVASALTETTGIKGTKRNLFGIYKALNLLVDKAGIALTDLSMIRINEATPVIGDVAMETITETIITESTMIGHNPQTPGGVGVGVGTTIALGRLATLPAARYAEGWIALIDDAVDFLDAVWWLNEALDRGINVVAAILKKDDGVLVNNRLRKTLPVVDEVTLLEQVPEGVMAAVEVAAPSSVAPSGPWLQVCDDGARTLGAAASAPAAPADSLHLGHEIVARVAQVHGGQFAPVPAAAPFTTCYRLDFPVSALAQAR